MFTQNYDVSILICPRHFGGVAFLYNLSKVKADKNKTENETVLRTT